MNIVNIIYVLYMTKLPSDSTRTIPDQVLVGLLSQHVSGPYLFG